MASSGDALPHAAHSLVRAATLTEGRDAGGNLLTREVVKGRHKKGVDIVGDEATPLHRATTAAGTYTSLSSPGSGVISRRGSGDVTFLPHGSIPSLHAADSSASFSAAGSPFHSPAPRKSAATTARLRSALCKHFLFSSLAPSELDQVVDALHRVVFETGAVVARANDVVGNAFYFVERGTFRIQTLDDRVSYASAGSAFGEAALMYSAPSDITVVAVDDVAADEALEPRLVTDAAGRSSRSNSL
ncbi:cyclic nucleotide-binding domain-containing protein, partial [archaeon]